MLTVSEIMTPWPQRVDADATLLECLSAMEHARCRHLPVMSRAGRLQGMLDDLQVVGALARGRQHTTRAGDLARPAEMVVGPDAPLVPLMDQMLASKQCGGLVSDGRSLLGIVTCHDLVRLAPSVVPADEVALRHARGDVPALDRARPASDALAAMLDLPIRQVLVLSDGLLYGVVTLFDLVDAGLLDGHDTRLDRVITSTRIDHATPRTSLRTAARMMAEWQIGCLPILDERERPLATLLRAGVIAALRTHLESHPESMQRAAAPTA